MKTRTAIDPYFALTLRRARLWVAKCAQDGITIDDNKTRRRAGESLSDCIKRHREHAYIVRDTYRPGWYATGKSPKDALNKAGMYPSFVPLD